ncbi:response regulator [Candidatus Sumerlaeota bacterium]|nr:response regulator [Candidatus Sumerlaeota bacterium]
MSDSRIKVLVADDDPGIQEFYRISLKDHFDVVIARDGLEAWKLFQSEKPLLVITDLNMPGENGANLTSRMRNHEELGDTPIIIITGTTRGTDLPPGFWRIGTQADLFLEKPISSDDLVAAVRRVLLKHQEKHQKPVVPRYLE